MAKIIIDGKKYEANEDRNCLEVALENDLDLPYFCYHPALGAVGSCRLCAVKSYKDEDDKTGRIVMSCMEPVSDGKHLSIVDKDAAEFRKWVIEWLMINHPHDCPICDEGGECHLQDMTVMTGHRERRFRGKKRTHNNQYLGPLINHEMNRCIQCYRCVRYYQDYAGGSDLVALAQRNHVYFGRHEDGVLESPFSGNLIDVCPTGVFTDKTLKDHFVRKWDQESAPSICTQCGLGCNTIPGARYGKIRRILPRYNEEVNGYFICDRGRFGYEYVNSEKRLREPQILVRGERQVVDREKAWTHIKNFCEGEEAVAGVGSPRASLECNFALRKLVGTANFSNGLSAADHKMTQIALEVHGNHAATAPTLIDIENSDAIFVLGADLSHEAPRVALGIRQAVRKGAALWVTASRGTDLDQVATARSSLSPEDLLTCATQVRETFFKKKKASPKASFAHQVASGLSEAERPLIIAGWYHGQTELFRTAAAIAEALQEKDKKVRLLFAFPEANHVSAGLLGGRDVDSCVEDIENGKIKRLIVAENDLFERTRNPARLQKALTQLDRLLVLDHSLSETTAQATEFIPVATPLESNGTWVNAEGRAQRAYQVFRPSPWVPESWEVLRDLPNRQGQTQGDSWLSPENILADLASEEAIFKAVLEITPPPSYRQQGQKLARMTHRFSGRTAMPSIRDVRDHLKPPSDPETPFAFSMEGSPKEPPSALTPRYWAPNWNSQEAINKYQIELGKGLHSGAAGKRLFDNVGASLGTPLAQEGAASSAPTKQEAIKLSKDEILLVPTAEIFGSEPFSRQTEAIAALMPKPYLELHPETAEKFQVTEGDLHRITVGEDVLELHVHFNETVPLDIGIFPVGFLETRHIHVPVLASMGEKT